jgi:hypothetical protein
MPVRIPNVIRGLEEVDRLECACIVDEDVDDRKALNESRASLGRADIGGDGTNPLVAERLAQPRGRRFHLRPIATVDDDGCACRGKAMRDRIADALARSCDDSGLACEVDVESLSPSISMISASGPRVARLRSGRLQEAFVDAGDVGERYIPLDEAEAMHVLEHRFDRRAVDLQVERRHITLEHLAKRPMGVGVVRMRSASENGGSFVQVVGRPLHSLAHRSERARRQVAAAFAPVEVERDRGEGIVGDVFAGLAEIGEARFLDDIVVGDELEARLDRALL